MNIRASSITPLIVASLAVAVADHSAFAAAITSVAPAQTIGPAECRAPYGSPQCLAQPFNRTGDLAYAGNGSARPAVVRDTIAGYPNIHAPKHINDGLYGNGASWISASPNSWVKIDLGAPTRIDRIRFGRDRIGGYDDRDPGQFVVWVADSDAVYANGDDSDDGAEYRMVLYSSQTGYTGNISGKETVQASFNPVIARFVKLRVANVGTAIDEIEVFGESADQGPTVAQRPASEPPTVPAGMKVTCMLGPNTLQPSANCPVLEWNGYTYWAFSYIDNRDAMGIVAYDSAGRAVAQWEKSGSRYVHAIAVYEESQTVIFGGQDYSKIGVNWDDLAIPNTYVYAVDEDTVPLGQNGVGITVYPPDDHIACTLNGETVAQLNYGDRTTKVDLTTKLLTGANEIRCIAKDNQDGACYLYAFDVWTKQGAGAEHRVAGSAVQCCDASCARPGNPVMDRTVWVNKP